MINIEITHALIAQPANTIRPLRLKSVGKIKSADSTWLPFNFDLIYTKSTKKFTKKNIKNKHGSNIFFFWVNKNNIYLWNREIITNFVFYFCVKDHHINIFHCHIMRHCIANLKRVVNLVVGVVYLKILLWPKYVLIVRRLMRLLCCIYNRKKGEKRYLITWLCIFIFCSLFFLRFCIHYVAINNEFFILYVYFTLSVAIILQFNR